MTFKTRARVLPCVRTLAPSVFEGTRLVSEPGAVAVCFHADWCGFCRRFLPLFEARAQGAPIPFLLADLSSKDDPRWDAFALRVVPTIILFKQGKPVWRADAPLGVGLFGRDIDRLLAAAKRS